MISSKIKSLVKGTSVAALLLVSAAASANSSQFFAKQYTEALGRAPDAGAWKSNQNYFAANGCNKNSLKAVSQGIFNSGEYANLGYDNYEKVLTAYRAIFSREPDAGGFNYWVAYLNNGNSLSSMIDFLFQSIDGAELTTAKICGSLGYGWKTDLPLTNGTIPAKDDGGVKTREQLDAALRNAQPGSTVYLSQRAVISVTSTLVVPAGVTLATVGRPSRMQYAKQARLVRGAVFGDNNGFMDSRVSSVVTLASGAKLDSVWVSGQEQVFGYNKDAMGVTTQPGSGTTVVNSRVDNSMGFTSIILNHHGLACNSMLVHNNLITGYSHNHGYNTDVPGYTDGVSGDCEDFAVSHNDIIDASDMGVVVFAPGLGRTQKSQVVENVVISAGVPAYGAFMLNPQNAKSFGATSSFSGAAILNNQFWAAPDTHFDFGVVLGGATWEEAPSVGIGSTASGNTNAGVMTPMYIGILVDAMNNAVVSNNAISRTTPQASFRDNAIVYKTNTNCDARGDLVADLQSTNHASEAGLPPNRTNAIMHGCVGHSR